MQYKKVGFEMSKNVFVVSATLIDQSGNILLAKRPEGKDMSGLWEFPGGKIEENESPEKALCRELLEELGIFVKESWLIPFTFVSHPYDNFHLVMPVYACSRWKGDAKALEHDEIRWVSPSDIGKYSVPEADYPIIEQIANAF